MEYTKWLVAHVRPQWERIVCKQLDAWYALQHFCPFHFVKRRFASGFRLVQVPLFKNYVFVAIDSQQFRLKVLQLDGVLSFVQFEGLDAVISESQMMELKSLVDQHSKLEMFSLLKPGNNMKFSCGVFHDISGTVECVSPSKVYLNLPQLGLRLVANKESLEIAK